MNHLKFLFLGLIFVVFLSGCSTFAPKDWRDFELQKPELVQPGAGADDVTRPVLFRWKPAQGLPSFLSEAATSIEYTLEVSKTSDFAEFDSTEAIKRTYEVLETDGSAVRSVEYVYHLADLSARFANNTEYYWRVRAHDRTYLRPNKQSLSATQKFKMKNLPAPDGEGTIVGYISQKIEANVALATLNQNNVTLTRTGPEPLDPDDPYCFPPDPTATPDPIAALCVAVVRTAPGPVYLTADAAELVAGSKQVEVEDGEELPVIFKLSLDERPIEMKVNNGTPYPLHPQHNAGLSDDPIQVDLLGSSTIDVRTIDVAQTRFGPDGAVDTDLQAVFGEFGDDSSDPGNQEDARLSFMTSAAGLVNDCSSPPPYSVSLHGEGNVGQSVYYFSAEDEVVDADCNAGCH